MNLAITLGSDTDEVVQASVRKAHTYRIPSLDECNKDLHQACERAMFDIFVPDNVILTVVLMII
jgi:hypothetical protein